MEIRETLSKDFKKAKLSVKLNLIGEKQGSLEVTICNKEELIKRQERKLLKDEEHEVQTFMLEVENPLLWSAEKPNLYDLLITVKDEEDQILEVIPQKVGFRKFE